VTVVGENRRVNVALPAAAPIAEFVIWLARMCGNKDDDAFPAVWSVARAGSAPLPTASSLSASGVVDGEVLYLRDAAMGEADEPAVMELDEAVERAATRFESWRWTPRTRAVAWVSAGCAWLVAAFLALAADGRVRADGGRSGALVLAAALGSSGLAAWACRRRKSMPGAVIAALAVSVIPQFAVAAWLAVGSHATPGGAMIAAAVGAVVGSVFCLAAVPGTVTAAVMVLVLTASSVAIVLSIIRADTAQSAGAAIVVAFALSSIAPQVVGKLVAYAPFERQRALLDGGRVPEQVALAWWMLATWNLVIAVAEAAALVELASSRDAFALGLVGCASCALVIRGDSLYATAVVPGALAGAVGALVLLLELSNRTHDAGWIVPSAGAVIGLGLVAFGLAGSFPGGRRKRGERLFAWASTVLRVACVPLMFGVFGVFGHLENLGRHL
jgi:type VII secretion integral membrane protein EccD